MSPIYVPGKVTLAKEFTWNETVWNPSMISTALWLDAADTSTMTTVSGSVSQWNDKSGNSRNAIQTNSLFRPVLTLGALNSKSVVSFTGSSGGASQFLPVTPALDIYQSAFIVYSNTNSITYATPLGSVYDTTGDIGGRGGSYHGSTSPQLFSSSFTRSETLNGQNFANGTSIGDGLSATRPTTPTIYSHVATSAFTAQNALSVIGSDLASNVNRGITGIIAEVIMLQGAALTVTRQKLEGYLAHKWGLTANLPSDHPYKLVGPTP